MVHFERTGDLSHFSAVAVSKPRTLFSQEISAISAKNAALGVTQALRPDYFSKGVIGSGPAEVSRGVRQEASREL